MPKLKIVKASDPGVHAPPRPLGTHGAALWASVTGEYDISDSGGVEMLTLACQALDRAEDLRGRIDADGSIIETADGALRDHPALRHELAARAFVVKTLKVLGLSFEAVRSGPGRPTQPLGITHEH